MVSFHRSPLAGVVAFAAPAAVAVALGLRQILTGSEVVAGQALGTYLAGVYLILAFALPPLRRLLADLGAFLVERLPFPVLLLAAIVALLCATGSSADAAPWGLFAALAVLAVTSGRATAGRRPGHVAGVVLVLILNLLLLAAFDVVVRVLVLPTKSQNSLYIVHDPWLGWKLRPGLSVTRVNDVYRSRETINSIGFRTPEVPFAKPPGTTRVLILGDSHSEAYTVSDDETYAVTLQAELGKASPAEVICLGVGGFSTDQELLCYVHYGRVYHPDLVLLQTASNDVAFNVLDRYWRGRKPRFARHGDVLLLEGVPVPETRLGLATHPLLRHSAIALTLDAVLGGLSIVRTHEQADLEEAWRVTDALVRDLAGIVRADGARLVMFDATPDKTEEDEGFRRIAQSHAVPFVDISPAFGGEIARYRISPGNLHWNKDGHSVVAKFLAPRLLEFLR